MSGTIHSYDQALLQREISSMEGNLVLMKGLVEQFDAAGTSSIGAEMNAQVEALTAVVQDLKRMHFS